jgi:hypothetical protein
MGSGGTGLVHLEPTRFVLFYFLRSSQKTGSIQVYDHWLTMVQAKKGGEQPKRKNILLCIPGKGVHQLCHHGEPWMGLKPTPISKQIVPYTKS